MFRLTKYKYIVNSPCPRIRLCKDHTNKYWIDSLQTINSDVNIRPLSESNGWRLSEWKSKTFVQTGKKNLLWKRVYCTF